MSENGGKKFQIINHPSHLFCSKLLRKPKTNPRQSTYNISKQAKALDEKNATKIRRNWLEKPLNLLWGAP